MLYMVMLRKRMDWGHFKLWLLFFEPGFYISWHRMLRRTLEGFVRYWAKLKHIH